MYRSHVHLPRTFFFFILCYLDTGKESMGMKGLNTQHSYTVLALFSIGLEREKRKGKMCFPIQCKVSGFGYRVYPKSLELPNIMHLMFM